LAVDLRLVAVVVRLLESAVVAARHGGSKRYWKKVGRRRTCGKHRFSVGMSIVILMIRMLRSGLQQGEDGRRAAQFLKGLRRGQLLNTLGEALRIYCS
jgi:hypothetical protein